MGVGEEASAIVFSTGAKSVCLTKTTINFLITGKNTGFLADGAVVHLARGAEMEPPVHLLFVSVAGRGGPSVAYPRVLVLAEEGVNASIVESHVGIGDGVYFSNAVTEVVAGPNSFVDHNKLQQETLQAYHISATSAHLARDSEPRNSQA